ncbi:MAG: hypothetical protein ACYTG1_09225 [Planctomycetota bacterium]|jgi:hypothetical protein
MSTGPGPVPETRASRRPTPAPDDPVFDRAWRLDVVLRDAATDRVLDTERVSGPDLLDAQGEAWFDGFVRRGHRDLPFEDLRFDVAPSRRDGGCDGFLVRARPRDGGGAAALHFPAAALAHTADRAATRLLASGDLAEGSLYLYTVRGTAEAGPHPASASAAADLRVEVRSTRPALDAVPLGPLLAAARRTGDVAADDLPVVFRRAALEKAERYARKGAAAAPPVETGCMLVGRLGADPGDATLYLLVDDAIEVRAEEAEFSLVYTAATWSDIHRALAGPAGGGPRRLVGQAHGHNFRLDGEPCAECATRAECTRTTVFTSGADRRFMRTVFARQPWALCWIAGTNARGDSVSALYTFRRGVLRRRGYFVTDAEPASAP